MLWGRRVICNSTLLTGLLCCTHTCLQLPFHTLLYTSAVYRRCYSSASFWDVPHPSPRHELFLELDTARGMLPNRANFKTHFSPHGVQLMPHRIAHMAPFDPLAAYEAAEGAAEDDEHLDVPIMADSVKRKRRMKIKKHKVCLPAGGRCAYSFCNVLVASAMVQCVFAWFELGAYQAASCAAVTADKRGRLCMRSL